MDNDEPIRILSAVHVEDMSCITRCGAVTGICMLILLLPFAVPVKAGQYYINELLDGNPPIKC